MVEKEVLFAGLALALGPPPTDATGLSVSTGVGGKGKPRILDATHWKALHFSYELHFLARQAAPSLGLSLLDVSPENLMPPHPELVQLYQSYVRWYERQELARAHGEMI